MPGTEAQQKAAGVELGRRRRGIKKSKSRAFGTAKLEDLRDFARKPESEKKEPDRKAIAKRLMQR